MYHKKYSIMMCMFLSLAILFGLCCTDAAAAGADNLELRIMTFNIRYGSANDGENRCYSQSPERRDWTAGGAAFSNRYDSRGSPRVRRDRRRSRGRQ